jgi:histidyl-tRNA synthetase
MVFEIYAGDDTNTQLCGGGRYDGLARTLGARQDVPALGFAFGLERLVDVIASDPTPPAERVLVCGDGVGPADVLAAADSLRKEGVIVETDVRERSVRANADYAARAGIRRVLVARRGESGELQLVDALEAVRA